jgi:hypothetical protein
MASEAAVPSEGAVPSEAAHDRKTRRPLGRRVLVAIIAGLVAVVVILSGLVIDLGRARLDYEAQLAENTRLINALTKQLYWAEEQLDALRDELAR